MKICMTGDKSDNKLHHTFYSVIQEDLPYYQSNEFLYTLKLERLALLPEVTPQCNKVWMIEHKDLGRGVGG